MNRRFFRPFFSCLLLSLALLALAVDRDLPPLLIVLFGGAPLTVYHLLVLAPRRGDLTATEIDSVYYLGFIVTLGALGAGGYLASTGKFTNDPAEILSHFGVGLLATGYAVVARLHLTSLVAREDLETTEAIFDKQVEGARAILDSMLLVVADASRLSAGMAEAREQIIRIAADTMQGVTTEIASEYQTQLRSVLQDTKVLAERTAAAVVTLEAAASTGVAEKVSVLSDALSRLSGNVSSFADAALDAAAATSQNAEESAKLRSSLNALQSEFERTGLLGETIASLQSQTSSAVSAMTRLHSSISESASAINGASEEISHAPKAFARMNRLSEQVQSTLDELAGAVERMNATANVFNSTSEAMVRFEGNVEKAAEKTDSVRKAIDTVADGLQTVATSAQGGAASLRELISLKTDLKSAVSAVNAASKAWEAAPVLESTSRDLAILSARLTQVSEAVLAASSNLDTQIVSVARRLEADMQNSTAQVLRLEERLIKLVDTIIVQTSRRQGVQP